MRGARGVTLKASPPRSLDPRSLVSGQMCLIADVERKPN